MGRVYEAIRDLGGRRVALKVLHPRLARDARSRRHLRREAHALAAAAHAHVVSFLELGETRRGRPYLVLEWLGGITVNSSAFWATPEELAEVATEIAHIADRFRGRKDPAKRPAGSRKAHFFATLNPDFDLPATPAASEEPDAG